MSHHEPVKPEYSNPVLWTVALLVFTIGTLLWFSYWMGKGETYGMTIPKHAADAGPTKSVPDHAKLIGELNDDVLKQGKKVFLKNCITCHGTDGAPVAAGARNFVAEAFKNDVHGAKAHPWSMYDTLTNGFNGGLMPPQGHIPVEDRYAVIHYIRETFVKEQNASQYVSIEEALKSDFPAPAAGSGEVAMEGPHPRFKALEVPVYAALAKQSGMTQSQSAWLANVQAGHGNTAVNNAIAALKGFSNTALGDQLAAQVKAGQSDAFVATLLKPEVAAIDTSFASLTKQDFQELYNTVAAARSK